MGSTGHYWGREFFYSKPPTVKEYIDSQITSTNEAGDSWRVLKSVTKAGVYYAAVEIVRHYQHVTQRIVLAVVQPYEFYGRGWERMLYVKDGDETMGMYHTDCPNSILDILTEPINDQARVWRAKCYELNNKINPCKTVKVGDTLIFENPFDFGSYGKARKFLVTQWGRKKRFVAEREDGGLFGCRLSRDIFNRVSFAIEPMKAVTHPTFVVNPREGN
jgi:hypothetical protein